MEETKPEWAQAIESDDVNWVRRSLLQDRGWVNDYWVCRYVVFVCIADLGMMQEVRSEKQSVLTSILRFQVRSAYERERRLWLRTDGRDTAGTSSEEQAW